MCSRRGRFSCYGNRFKMGRRECWLTVYNSVFFFPSPFFCTDKFNHRSRGGYNSQILPCRTSSAVKTLLWVVCDSLMGSVCGCTHCAFLPDVFIYFLCIWDGTVCLTAPFSFTMSAIFMCFTAKDFQVCMYVWLYVCVCVCVCGGNNCLVTF